VTTGGLGPGGRPLHARWQDRPPAPPQRVPPRQGPRRAAGVDDAANGAAGRRRLQPPRPAPARRRPELTDAAVVSRSWGIAFATLISRLTGFTRIVLLAAILGAALSSAFSVANQLPNLVAALVLEATFTAIFVPVLARAERDDPDGGTAFVRRLVTLATALLLVATALSVAATPLLVRLMLGDHPQVNSALTTAFAYLLLPQVLFYGLSSVFMAILNTRNLFGAPAWAPVVNNVVAIATLGVYLLVPGELSVDPVEMGNAKLLVLGIGTTLGVAAQTTVLLIAIARERTSLRPLWGIDDRLKQFGAMAAAMVLYVLISQFGLIIGNQIASWAAASGPAIYNYTWLVLMLPFGMIGVTVLTVVMPRLSRNAADENIAAVLGDLSLATRLIMVTLIPTVAFMTVGGAAIGSALFAYGRFGSVDAGYLGNAIALSAFTLIPYATVLLQLRVFYARHQPWTPIVIIIVITGVKIGASVAVKLLAEHGVIDDHELVAGYLGLSNGLGFLAGATAGYLLLRRALRPAGGGLFTVDVVRTVLVTVAGSLAAALVAYVADRLLRLYTLTERFGGAGSLLRLLILALIMGPIIATVMLAARVPEAQAALAAVRRRLLPGKLSRSSRAQRRSDAVSVSDGARPDTSVTYSEQRLSYAQRPRSGPETVRHGPGPIVAESDVRKGMAVTDETAGSGAPDATTRLTRPVADDFQPDVPDDPRAETAEIPRVGGPPGDFAGDPTRESMGFAAPRETADSSRSDDDAALMPGASIADGRYRLLVPHGGPEVLQFWQALDTALDRQVALTFVDPEGQLSPDDVQEILSLTLRLSRIEMPGIARVLDVVRTRSGGLVVSEWIRGGSLKEVADTAPSPIGGARATQSLAAAAEAAHRAGVTLSVDHPSRIRVSIEGDVALAFPASLPSATEEDDVRGIGAALYALLINRWPLAEPGVPSGLAPAARDAAGNPVEPKAVDADIPFPISAAAVRAVQPTGGITSAATLLNLLQQATAEADRTELITPVEEPAPSVPSRFRAAFRGSDDLDDETRTRRRVGLLGGMIAAGAIILVALLLLASTLKGCFADIQPFNPRGFGAGEPSTSESAPGGVVKPVKVAVFSPGGQAPDHPELAKLAIDGDPATAWETDLYLDADPFPGFKTGVGLMLQLPKPTVLKSVAVTVNSTGTAIEVRSSPSESPSSLNADTTVLAQATPMKKGLNEISITNTQPVSYVLVFITKLGKTAGDTEKYHAEIADITLQAGS
jgi:putative peptidoglycan lipid II flippase